MSGQDRIELLRSTSRHELADNRMTMVAPGFGMGSLHHWDGSWDNDADELPVQMEAVYGGTDGVLGVRGESGEAHRLLTNRRVWWPHAIHATSLGAGGTVWKERKCIVDDVAVDVIDVHGSGLRDARVWVSHPLDPADEIREFPGGVLARSRRKRVRSLWRCIGFPEAAGVTVRDGRQGRELCVPVNVRSECPVRLAFAVAAGENAREVVARWRRVAGRAEESPERARGRWAEFFDRHVPGFSCGNERWERLFAACFHVLRANLYTFEQGAIHHPYSCPSKWRLCPSWFWDPCFHGFAEKWMREYPAPVSTFRNHFEAQEPDGYLPMTLDTRGNTWRAMGANARQCQQFLHPLTLWDWYLVHGGKRTLAKCLPRVAAHADYLASHRQPDAWPLFVAENGAEVADNSARLVANTAGRDGLGNLRAKIQPFDWNAFLCLAEDRIARMAREVGQTRLARRFAERAAQRAGFLRRCWNPRTGLFADRILPEGALSDRRIPESLLSLLAGVAGRSQTRSQLAFLRDPARLWTRFPVPTLPLDDPDFSDADTYASYWNGRVWPNMNWCYVEALARAGERRTGRALLDRCLEMATPQGEPWIAENYRPQSDEPYSQPHCSVNYGWGAVWADLLLRRAAGLQLNAPGRSASIAPWGLPGCSEIEITGLPFARGLVDAKISLKRGRSELRAGGKSLTPSRHMHWLEI